MASLKYPIGKQKVNSFGNGPHAPCKYFPGLLFSKFVFQSFRSGSANIGSASAEGGFIDVSMIVNVVLNLNLELAAVFT